MWPESDIQMVAMCAASRRRSRIGILSGIKVLDLSRILSGPYITMCLGDMGANVIKVEQPIKGDDTRHWGPPFIGADSPYFLSINRNKRSIAVNLKHPEGRALILTLARTADIVVENFRPGGIDRLGLGYEDLKAVNPKLIMLSISAFGDTGPYRDRPGYDLLAQAMGGLMSLTGEEDGPPVKAGFAMADLGAAMFGLTGILAALFHRATTGEGQRISTSLYETQLAFHINWAGNYFVNHQVPRRLGSAHPNLAPYQAFAASDGHFVIAVGNDTLFQKLLSALQLEALREDPRFLSNALRVEHRAELQACLEPVLSQNTRDHWYQTLGAAGVPVGPILDLADIYSDAHTEALGIVQSMDHPACGKLRQVAFPVHFANQPAKMQLPPPLIGQHTADILKEAGYTPDAIAKLNADGAIALPL